MRQTSPEELSGSAIRDGMNQVIERWLATRGMAPMGFLLRVEPFTFPPHRRCFVALVGDRLVGFAGVVPVPARGGWFIEDLVRDPSAPNGTSELLIDAVMQWAHEEGSRWLTLGLAPLAGDVSGWLRLARNTTQPLYDFRGLHRYKAKLRPSSWSPIYLTYPRSQGALTSIFDALVAFTRVGLVRFALRSLLRGPTAVLRPLALLLVPWTVVLAFAPGEPWFGSPWVKWAWVTFDAALVVALLQLLRRPNVRLTVALAIAVTLDALLTAIQAAVWNVPRAEGPLDYAIIAIACLGPLLAAVVLWGAALRLRRLR